MKEWKDIIEPEFEKPYHQELKKFIENEYATKTVYPPRELIFEAFDKTPFNETKVVILGQDPYCRKGQAHGMSFSVKKGVPIPPSLLNIYKELNSELGCYIPNNGYLMKWAKQGVLLLNSTLTVVEGKPNAHANTDWHILTDAAISALNNENRPIVFMLWGNNAREKKCLLNNPNHLILESYHPSPRSAYGFFGNGHFIKCNEFLKNNGIQPIDWQIENI